VFPPCPARYFFSQYPNVAWLIPWASQYAFCVIPLSGNFCICAAIADDVLRFSFGSIIDFCRKFSGFEGAMQERGLPGAYSHMSHNAAPSEAWAEISTTNFELFYNWIKINKGVNALEDLLNSNQGWVVKADTIEEWWDEYQ
jgi:hypothetical protein